MRYAPRRGQFPYWLVAATTLAALIAVVPIVAAIVAGISGGSPKTAFASAPAGNYAVVVRAEEEADTIVVVSTSSDEETEIATVPHIRGYASYGAVAPDGKTVALVTTDRGTAAQPVASLLVVELETARVRRIAASVDYLQTPVWAPDSGSVVVTRTAGTDVTLVRVSADGSGEGEAARVTGALGAYPVGFDTDGRLVYVVVDGRGSTAFGDGTELAHLADGITRDWRLSPDGASLAFIETSTAEGVKYFARTMALDGSAAAQTMVAGAEGQALGAAWAPRATAPTFGREPGSVQAYSAESRADVGFDVPLGYTPDGEALAVQHWTGVTFADPGEGELQIVAGDGSRQTLKGFARFYGWATR